MSLPPATIDQLDRIGELMDQLTDEELPLLTCIPYWSLGLLEGFINIILERRKAEST